MLAVIYLESQRIFKLCDYRHSCNSLNHHYLTGFRGTGSRIAVTSLARFVASAVNRTLCALQSTGGRGCDP